MSRPLIALMISLGLAVSAPLQAAKPGTYVWKDENGNTQYSDRPPEGVKSEFIEIQGIGLKGGKPPRTEQSNEVADEQSDDAEAEDKAPLKEYEVLPDKNPALCKQARENLKALKAARIRGVDENGERRYLSEEEKAAQRATAQKIIRIHCN